MGRDTGHPEDPRHGRARRPRDRLELTGELGGTNRYLSPGQLDLLRFRALVVEQRFGPALEKTPKGRIRHMMPPAEAIARMRVAPALRAE